MNSTTLKTRTQDDTVLETTSDLRGVLAILQLGRHVYGQLAISIGVITAGAVAVMISAYVLGQLVEVLTGTGVAGSLADPVDQRKIRDLGIGFLTLEIFSVGCQYLGRMQLSKATLEISLEVRRALFAKIARLPIAYFDYQPLGRTVTRVTSDVAGLENFFSGTLARLLTACIQIASVLVAMAVTDLKFGLIVIAASLPALLFSVALRRPVRHWMRLYRHRSSHINAKLAEFINGLTVIKIFGLEGWTQQTFGKEAGRLYDAGISVLNWNSLIRPTTVLLCGVPTLLILWWGGEQVLTGTMTLGLLVTFLRYSERFVTPVRQISQDIQNIQEALVASERVHTMLSEAEEDESLGPDGDYEGPLQGDVTYRNVKMSYKHGEPVLNDVSFAVQAGMKVGLVGATGSGKTTTINLLPSLYPFNSGTILLDGRPLKEWKRQSVRSQLGYVGQDIVVVSGTMRANLIAALPEGSTCSDQRLMAVCAQTGLADIIKSKELPGEQSARPGEGPGLDYELVEGGDNLSQGERQLIAFTRMMLRDPAILILDEATANVDEECEALIQKAVNEAMVGRTSFVIAHRLSTIIQCDVILVFERGRIVEQGSHQELLAHNGVYASLARRQLQGCVAS